MEDQAKYAADAARVLDNEAFKEAIRRMREDAFSGLVSVKAESTFDVIRMQMEIAATDEILRLLGAMAQSKRERVKPGVA